GGPGQAPPIDQMREVLSAFKEFNRRRTQALRDGDEEQIQQKMAHVEPSIGREDVSGDGEELEERRGPEDQEEADQNMVEEGVKETRDEQSIESEDDLFEEEQESVGVHLPAVARKEMRGRLSRRKGHLTRAPVHQPKFDRMETGATDSAGAPPTFDDYSTLSNSTNTDLMDEAVGVDMRSRAFLSSSYEGTKSSSNTNTAVYGNQFGPVGNDMRSRAQPASSCERTENAKTSNTNTAVYGNQFGPAGNDMRTSTQPASSCERTA
ncbi:hypothetical protein PFISCL1PPCAC_5738, partial [Pristionchus fissidentatus]